MEQCPSGALIVVQLLKMFPTSYGTEYLLPCSKEVAKLHPLSPILDGLFNIQ
jgi:hypothetical protein